MREGVGGRAEIQGMAEIGPLCCLAPGAGEPVGVLGGSGEVGRSWPRVRGGIQ